MNFDEALQELKGFSLEGDYCAHLRQLTDHILDSPRRDEALGALFHVLERYPEEDFGTPGPVVHAIEKCHGYEHELFEAINKHPSTTFVWMLRRLYNKTEDRQLKDACCKKLEMLVKQSDVDEQVREDATICLHWLSNS